MLANVLAKQKHKNSKQHSRTYFVHFASATICLMYVTGHFLQPPQPQNASLDFLQVGKPHNATLFSTIHFNE